MISILKVYFLTSDALKGLLSFLYIYIRQNSQEPHKGAKSTAKSLPPVKNAFNHYINM